MTTEKPSKPRVFIDSDVLFAGAASPSEHSASLVVLRMAEITLVEAIVSEQVIVEVERNLTAKIPEVLPAFRLIVSRCVNVVPAPLAAKLPGYEGLADPKDLPILVAAVEAKCPWLVTFNTRHFQPGHPDLSVMKPGELILRVRDLLAHL
jgi:predicted nucleic acid-binding protein